MLGSSRNLYGMASNANMIDNLDYVSTQQPGSKPNSQYHMTEGSLAQNKDPTKSMTWLNANVQTLKASTENSNKNLIAAARNAAGEYQV